MNKIVNITLILVIALVILIPSINGISINKKVNKIKNNKLSYEEYTDTINLGKITIYDGIVKINLKENPISIVSYDIDDLYKLTVDCDFKEGALNTWEEKWEFSIDKDVSDTDIKGNDSKSFSDNDWSIDEDSRTLYVEVKAEELFYNPVEIYLQGEHSEYKPIGENFTWVWCQTDYKWKTVHIDFEFSYEPEIRLTSNLDWDNVKVGSIIQGTVSLENIGQDGSKLDWRLKGIAEVRSTRIGNDLPSLDIEIRPKNGEDLIPEDGKIDIDVEIDTTPAAKGDGIYVEITCENTDDYCKSDKITYEFKISNAKSKIFTLENILSNINLASSPYLKNIKNLFGL